MFWTAKPFPWWHLGEEEKYLDLRAEFQDFWSMPESSVRLGRPLRQAFENLVERHRLYEIIKIEERPGAERLTLANMWRLTRVQGETSGLLLHTFDLAQGRWREQAPETITWRKWEDGLTRPNNSETVWPDLESCYSRTRGKPGLFKNLMAAWLENIRPALSGEVKPSLAPGEEERFALLFFNWLVNLTARYRSEVINSSLGESLWFSTFLPLSRLHDVSPYLSRILAAQSEDLARIHRETPNIWPLLDLLYIPQDFWSRSDFLRDKALRAACPIFENFSPAGLRWLRRAPAETLASFRRNIERIEDHWRDEDRAERAREVAEVMAGLPPQATDRPELAEVVISCSWTLVDKIIETCPDCAPVLAKRLLFLQARHIVSIWDSGEIPLKNLDEDGVMRVLEEWLEGLLDWFYAEGRQLGLPDKNSTWSSLKRRADKWHREVWRRKMPEAENRAWESLLGPMEIGGIKIKPLVTGLDLYNESLEMRHCVRTYLPRCLNEGWRVFSLLEAGGTRSTLSLKPQNSGYAIDQHKGPYNTQVSPAEAKAAVEVCRLYNQKRFQALLPALRSSGGEDAL